MTSETHLFVWEGFLSLQVPEGWSVRDSRDLIEIVPPRPVGAVDISVLSRSDPLVQRGDAQRVLNNFVHNRPSHEADWHGPELSLGEHAFAVEGGFELPDPQGNVIFDVRVMVSPRLAIIGSYCHGGDDDETRLLGMKLLRSVIPQV